MANFEVKVRQIVVTPHPDPEVTKLEIGKIDLFNVVVPKEKYKTGDLVAYIPEGSVIPQALLEEMGLVGRLAGSAKNRVKPIKLRGILSEGLVYPARSGWQLGDDVASELGITKYIPEIPITMRGEVGTGERSFLFDLENIKKYPDLFKEGEEVVFTEKLHGSLLMISLIPKEEQKVDMYEGKYFVSSKGLGAKGIYLKDNESNANNVYLKQVKAYSLDQALENIKSSIESRPTQYNPEKTVYTVTLFGEVLGVQNLNYGNKKGQTEFRAFALAINGKYVSRDLFENLMEHNNVPIAPVLYRGPFSMEVVKRYTDGKETVSGLDMHIREGIVITPVIEKEGPSAGRASLKSISEAYLNQSSGEEFS